MRRLPSPRLRFPARVLRELQRACHCSFPAEACGVLLGVRRRAGIEVLASLPADNRMPRPEARRGFLLEPLALYRAESAARSMGAEVLGAWHSHPAGSAALSRRDRAGSGGYPFLFVLPLPAVGPPRLRVWESCHGDWSEVSWGLHGDLCPSPGE